MSTKAKSNKNKSLNSRQSVDQAVKSICDIMRRGNVTSAVQYIPELTWILFLRVLDETEQQEQIEAEALGITLKQSLVAPYRWRDWADPGDKNAEPPQAMGEKRQELENGSSGDIFAFVNEQLIPYLKGLENKPDATVRQKVISEIISGVDRVRIDTERNFLDVLDRVHKLSHAAIDKTHVFSLS